MAEPETAPEWLQPFISWLEEEVAVLNFKGAQVPKRLRYLLVDAFAWREERGMDVLEKLRACRDDRKQLMLQVSATQTERNAAEVRAERAEARITAALALCEAHSLCYDCRPDDCPSSEVRRALTGDDND